MAAMLATLNSGAAPFSLTLDLSSIASATPSVRRINVNASFMGVTFSPDSTRVYLSGGENGNIWIADAVAGRIIGSVNLNGPAHPLDRPLDVVANPARRFKGAFPGNMALTSDGRFLYVVDQGELPGARDRRAQDRRPASMRRARSPSPTTLRRSSRRVEVGRYPFGIALSPDDRTLFVTHVGVFEYTHLRPATPDRQRQRRLSALLSRRRLSRRDAQRSRDRDHESRSAQSAGQPPRSRRHPLRIRPRTTALHRSRTRQPERAAVFVGLRARRAAIRRGPDCATIVKTGPLVGQRENGMDVYSGSHPNAVVVGPDAIYVANGNNDSISVLDPSTYEERDRISLSLLRGQDRALKGVQPVGLALSPDGDYLYVAEAGVNAIGVIRLDGCTDI